MFSKFKNVFMQWVLQKLFIFLVEAYDKFGKLKVNEFIDGAISKYDDVLEKQFGKEKATKIEKEFLDMGEEYIKALKKEMND